MVLTPLIPWISWLLAGAILSVDGSSVAGTKCEVDSADLLNRTLHSEAIFVGFFNKTHRSSKDNCRYLEFHLDRTLKGNLTDTITLIVGKFEKKSETKVCGGNSLKRDANYLVFLESTVPYLDSEFQFQVFNPSFHPLPIVKNRLEEISEFLKYKKPTVKLIPEGNLEKSEGDQFNVTCEFSGYPPPSAHWERDDVIFVPTNFTTVINDSGQTTLNFSIFIERSAGDYACVVSNSLGTEKASIEIDYEKYHAVRCTFEGWCKNKGKCFISTIGNQLFCHCKNGYHGARCQSYFGDYMYDLKEKGDSTKELYFILILIVVVTFVVAAVVILLFAAVRSCHVGRKYEQVTGTVNQNNGHEDIEMVNVVDPVNQQKSSRPANGRVSYKVESVKANLLSTKNPAKRERLLASSRTPEGSRILEIPKENVWDKRESFSNISLPKSRDSFASHENTERIMKTDNEASSFSRNNDNFNTTHEYNRYSPVNFDSLSNLTQDGGDERLYIEEPIPPYFSGEKINDHTHLHSNIHQTREPDNTKDEITCL